MAKYDLGGLTELSGMDVTTSAELPQFADLIVGNVISQISQQERDSPWGVKTGGSIGSRSVIHRGILYFGANDHNLYAVDAKTGKELWRLGAGGPVSIWGSPVIWRKTIIFSCYDHNLYCISLNGKRIHWRFRAGDKMASTPLVHDGVVYIGSRDGRFYAVSAETGRLKWKVAIGHAICSSPIIHQGRIFFGSRNGFHCISISGGLVWSIPLNGDADSEIGAHGERLFFGCTDRNVYCASLRGRILWKYPTQEPVINKALVHGDRVIIGSFDGSVYCLDLDGRLVWRFLTGGAVVASAQVCDEKLFFTSVDNRLYCTGLDGRLVWKLPVNLISYITVHDGAIYASGWDCKMHAISTEGKRLWEFKTSLGYMSDLELETTEQFTLDITVIPGHRRKGEVDEGKAGEFGSYGGFRGSYIGEDMRDYIGTPVREGLPGTAYKGRKDVYGK
jgi:outer membrane protein assembly factor BamB